MKRILLPAIVLTGMLVAPASWASLDFSSVNGSQLDFESGSQFTFTAGSVVSGFDDQWQIQSPGAAQSLFGNFDGSPSTWAYGNITTSGSTETANVLTPGGNITINDGAGSFLTGTLGWIQIQTTDSGSGGSLNGNLTINLSNLSYSGGNTALQALVGDSYGSLDLTFSFDPTEDLATLAGGGYETSYSGTMAPVPEASTLMAGSLLLLPLGLSMVRIIRKGQWLANDAIA